MFGSEILEVAIGLAFVYLLLSLICSAVNEWIASLFKMRSITLEKGIKNLLNDPNEAKRLYEHPLIKVLYRGEGKPSYIPSRTFALALLDIVVPASPDGKPKTLDEVRNAVVTKLPDPDNEMRKALLILINEAGDNLMKVQKNIEHWFDSAMDRVSGWYKRKTQLIILCVALIVSGLLNADSFMIANILWRDNALRASIVASAQETAKKPLSPDPDASLTRVKELHAELQQLDLPIGWRVASKQYEDHRETPCDIRGWFYKILGLLFTAFASSQGAPFWFDVLNKFVNLRGVGKRPEEKKKK